VIGVKILKDDGCSLKWEVIGGTQSTNKNKKTKGVSERERASERESERG
jgi:hypothetical protein